MHVLEIIPLTKSNVLHSLSYYSATPYETGTVLTIPLRKKEVLGMVVDCKAVSAAKTALRSATFSLRKLPAPAQLTKLPQALVQTAQHLSTHLPSGVGNILYALLPAEIRTGARAYPQLPDHLPGEPVAPTVITATTPDRYIAYRSLIREAFAHRGSVLFVVPTSAAVHYAEAELSSGIEKRVVTFSSTHTKKQLQRSYEAFENLSQSQLIITTPNFAFLARHDITHIIIEQSASQHYISRTRPYLDARLALKTYARMIGGHVLIGDTVPSTEDEIARRDEQYATYEEHSQRLQIPSEIVIARHRQESLTYTLITDELNDRIELALAGRGRILLYASRRGLAPLVLCKDCGYIFRCPDSGAPFSLLRTGSGDDEKRWFYCATSGVRLSAADICPACESWRLMEQGIGIQHVYDHITRQYPDTPTILADHLTANTHHKANRLADQFYSHRKAIMVASNIMLPYITKPVDYTGVISYEAMRSVPTWRADETVFHTLLTLREKTLKDVVVQTRTDTDELLTLAKKALVDQFYDGEIAIRHTLQYPPYAVFVLLTFMGDKAQVQSIETTITTIVTGSEITFYNGPLSRPDKIIRYGLLRIPQHSWPAPHLITALKQLPPYIKVEINPARIV